MNNINTVHDKKNNFDNETKQIESFFKNFGLGGYIFFALSTITFITTLGNHLFFFPQFVVENY